jgi:hypothetical protein
MRKLSLIPKLALAAVLVAGAASIPARALTAGGGGACPENYNPVICSNGVVYGNLCFANLDHATGCVPYATTF